MEAVEQSRPESQSLEGAPCYPIEEQPRRRTRSATGNGNRSRDRSKSRKRAPRSQDTSHSSGPARNKFENSAREAGVEKKSRCFPIYCNIHFLHFILYMTFITSSVLNALLLNWRRHRKEGLQRGRRRKEGYWTTFREKMTQEKLVIHRRHTWQRQIISNNCWQSRWVERRHRKSRQKRLQT